MIESIEKALKDLQEEIRGDPEFGCDVNPINDFLEGLNGMKEGFKDYLGKRAKEVEKKLKETFSLVVERNDGLSDYVNSFKEELEHSEEAKECVGCILYFTNTFKKLLVALEDPNKLDYDLFFKHTLNVRRIALRLKYDIFEHFMRFLPTQPNHDKDNWRTIQITIKDDLFIHLEEWINLVMENYNPSKLSESDLKHFESEKMWIKITKFHFS